VNRLERLCLAIYSRLAHAYPHEFRLICGEDLDQMGEDIVPEAWRRFGFFGLVRLLANTAIHLPVEYVAEMRQDAGYAWRVLAKSPVFTVVGILSLAIGIGMCSVILSESNGLLRPAPGIAEPSTLLTMRSRCHIPGSNNTGTALTLWRRPLRYSGQCRSQLFRAATRRPGRSEFMDKLFRRNISQPWA
jgi:hypothetical protein